MDKKLSMKRLPTIAVIYVLASFLILMMFAGVVTNLNIRSGILFWLSNYGLMFNCYAVCPILALVAYLVHRDNKKKGILEQLVYTMTTDPIPARRLDAYHTLNKRGYQAFSYMINTLKGEGDKDRVIKSAELLGAIGDSRAIAPLLDATAASGDKDIRLSTLAALGKFHDDRIFEPLVNIATKDTDNDLRLMALRMLEPYYGIPAIVPVLDGLLADPNSDIRRGAVMMIGKHADRQFVESLNRIILNDSDTAIRLSAIKVLGAIGDVRSIGPVKQALNDTSIDVRNAAAEALQRFNVPAYTDSGETIHEKEVIKEIVKVPCEYCGTLMEVTSTRCPSCGAPVSR